jgi:hypothetical protein
MTPDELSERRWRFAARAGKTVEALPGGRVGRQHRGALNLKFSILNFQFPIPVLLWLRLCCGQDAAPCLPANDQVSRTFRASI